MHFTVGSLGLLAAVCGAILLGEGAVADVVRWGEGEAVDEMRLVLMPEQETGELTEESETLESDGSYFAIHRFEGVAGEIVSIELTSEEFDPYILLRDPNGNVITENDDGFDGINSRIVIKLPESGTYSIVAKPYEVGETGKYEVSWQLTDQKMLELFSLYEEGRQFLNLGTADGYREAIVRLEAALTIADRIGSDSYSASVLMYLGLANQYLDYNSKALSHYQTALDGFRAMGDRLSEANILGNMGSIYANQGNNSEALNYYEQALTISRDVGNQEIEASILSRMGGVYSDLGNQSEALDYLNPALAIHREVGDRTWEAVTLNNLGEVYSALGDQSEALNYYEQALTISRDVGNQEIGARILSNMGGVYSVLGDRIEALDYYEQGLRMYRETGDRSAEAIVLGFIGKVYFDLGNPSEALRYYEQALPIHNDVGNRASEATSLSHIGTVYFAIGNPNEALRYFNQALPLHRDVGDRSGEASTLNDIGSVYSHLGDKNEALNYLNQALTIRHDEGDRLGEAVTLNNMGKVYLGMGNNSEALRYYEQALAIHRDVGSRINEAITLGNIGTVYSQLGRNHETLDYYEQALAIHREVGNRSGEATTLTNVGTAYSDQGNNSEALRYYEQALVIHREVGNRAHEAKTISSIGSIYSDRGNPSEALAYYEEALQISREVGDRAHEAGILNRLGVIDLEHEHISEALAYHEEALQISREVNDRPREASTLSHLSWVYRVQNDLPTALAYIEEAIAIIEQLRSEITSTELRTSYFATVQGYYQLQIDILMQLHQYQCNCEQNPESGYDRRAFNVSERTRARTLIELLAESNLDITTNLDPELQQRERNLRQQLQSLDAERVARLQAIQDNSEIAPIVSEFDHKTTQTLRQLDSLAAELRQTNPAYAAIQYPQPLTLEQIQQQVLDPDTTLLQYSLGDEQSYLWVVGQNRFESFILAGRNEIETAAREFYASVDRAGNPITSGRTAQALSELILAPVADRLTTERLLIVPDGILHQIPFSAIAVPNQTTYQPLISQHEIVSAPSSTVIATNRETMGDRPLAPHRLAVLADPIFSASDDRLTGRTTRESSEAIDPNGVSDLSRALRDFDLRNLARLPNTKTEADRLIALANGDETAVFDFDANYPWVTANNANRYQYVHFATHGFANSENPELSGLVLSLLDANGNPQNGFLRLGEIFNLQLPAELVVLSACQTGLGENVGGEGMVGLTRGLMYAGAERTVLSLWNVNDEKTADLMVRFYRDIWQNGLTPAAALRRAQLEMWQAGDHPYYWAAFGVQGEWRD
jgi:tetratricopeptide (TPR) repeat protein